MVTIILEAGDIPEGATGEKLYTMRRNGLTVYSNDYGHKFAKRDKDDCHGVTVYGAGKLHLICAEHIVLVDDGTLLAVDFETVEEAQDFLLEIKNKFAST